MTQEEIIKKFHFVNNAFFGKSGVCILCEYFTICDKMLPCFNKPNKCGGPFIKQITKEKKEEN